MKLCKNGQKGKCKGGWSRHPDGRRKVETGGTRRQGKEAEQLKKKYFEECHRPTMLLSTSQKLCQNRAGENICHLNLEATGIQVTRDEHFQTQAFPVVLEVLSETVLYFDFQRTS